MAIARVVYNKMANKFTMNKLKEFCMRSIVLDSAFIDDEFHKGKIQAFNEVFDFISDTCSYMVYTEYGSAMLIIDADNEHVEQKILSLITNNKIPTEVAKNKEEAIKFAKEISGKIICPNCLCTVEEGECTCCDNI